MTPRYCAARPPRLPSARPGVHGNRLRLIRETGRPVRVQVRMRYIANPGNAAVMAW